MTENQNETKPPPLWLTYISMLFIVGFCGYCILGPSAPSEKEIKLKDELKYLDDITDISWWEVDNNNVYICFVTVPSDWRLVLQGAALRGNARIGFGTHVTALVGEKNGWRPGDGGGYLGMVSARHGKIE